MCRLTGRKWKRMSIKQKSIWRKRQTKQPLSSIPLLKTWVFFHSFIITSYTSLIAILRSQNSIKHFVLLFRKLFLSILHSISVVFFLYSRQNLWRGILLSQVDLLEDFCWALHPKWNMDLLYYQVVCTIIFSLMSVSQQYNTGTWCIVWSCAMDICWTVVLNIFLYNAD